MKELKQLAKILKDPSSLEDQTKTQFVSVQLLNNKNSLPPPGEAKKNVIYLVKTNEELIEAFEYRTGKPAKPFAGKIEIGRLQKQLDKHGLTFALNSSSDNSELVHVVALMSSHGDIFNALEAFTEKEEKARGLTYLSHPWGGEAVNGADGREATYELLIQDYFALNITEQTKVTMLSKLKELKTWNKEHGEELLLGELQTTLSGSARGKEKKRSENKEKKNVSEEIFPEDIIYAAISHALQQELQLADDDLEEKKGVKEESSERWTDPAITQRKKDYPALADFYTKIEEILGDRKRFDSGNKLVVLLAESASFPEKVAPEYKNAIYIKKTGDDIHTRQYPLHRESHVLSSEDFEALIKVGLPPLPKEGVLEHPSIEMANLVARKCGYTPNKNRQVVLKGLYNEQLLTEIYNFIVSPAYQAADGSVKEKWKRLATANGMAPTRLAIAVEKGNKAVKQGKNPQGRKRSITIAEDVPLIQTVVGQFGQKEIQILKMLDGVTQPKDLLALQLTIEAYMLSPRFTEYDHTQRRSLKELLTVFNVTPENIWVRAFFHDWEKAGWIERILKAPMWIVRAAIGVLAQFVVYLPHPEDFPENKKSSFTIKRMVKRLSLACFAPLLATQLLEKWWEKAFSLTVSTVVWGSVTLLGVGWFGSQVFGSFVPHFANLGDYLLTVAQNPFFTEQLGLAAEPLAATFAIGLLMVGILIPYGIGILFEKPVETLDERLAKIPAGVEDEKESMTYGLPNLASPVCDPDLSSQPVQGLESSLLEEKQGPGIFSDGEGVGLKEDKGDPVTKTDLRESLSRGGSESHNSSPVPGTYHVRGYSSSSSASHGTPSSSRRCSAADQNFFSMPIVPQTDLPQVSTPPLRVSQETVDSTEFSVDSGASGGRSHTPPP